MRQPSLTTSSHLVVVVMVDAVRCGHVHSALLLAPHSILSVAVEELSDSSGLAAREWF